MASSSSESVEESFRARVEKVFGSLTSSTSQSSPWSLTDDELEKREWRRHKEDDETPCYFIHNLSKNEFGGASLDDDDKDEWDIRSSIGLDCTLDNEEEEDDYDKLAEGRENAGDRLYMRDITDHGPYLNSNNVLPNSAHGVARDPRANCNAAQLRLNAEEPRVIVSEDVKLKSILKRKNNATIKPSKRVRFDPACEDICEEELEEHNDSLTGASFCDSFLAENLPRVPDYLMNPSKYIRYSFDSSSEISKESNNQACRNILESIKGNASPDLPKSVMFIPRKKTSDDDTIINSSGVKEDHGDCPKQYVKQPGFAVGIAAGEAQQSEVGVMGEDETEIDTTCRSTGLQKPGRHYRVKLSLEDIVS